VANRCRVRWLFTPGRFAACITEVAVFVASGMVEDTYTVPLYGDLIESLLDKCGRVGRL
jgi:hypothetical protein